MSSSARWDARGGLEPADVSWILDVARRRGGFLVGSEVAGLAASPAHRLTLLLVRCGRCRFLCPAQDVAFLESCVVAGGDYVRDVSIPCERGV